VLLVPRHVVERAKGMADCYGMRQRLFITGIESFVSQTLANLAVDASAEVFEVVLATTKTFNKCIEQAGLSPSLKMDLCDGIVCA